MIGKMYTVLDGKHKGQRFWVPSSAKNDMKRGWIPIDQTAYRPENNSGTHCSIPLSSLSLLDVRVNAMGMRMIDDARRVVDEAAKLLNEVDWNVFLADVAEYLNRADDQRFIRSKNPT